MEMKDMDGIFSDNSFTLIPGETKTVVFTPAKGRKKAASADMLVTRHLRQSYK